MNPRGTVPFLVEPLRPGALSIKGVKDMPIIDPVGVPPNLAAYFLQVALRMVGVEDTPKMDPVGALPGLVEPLRRVALSIRGRKVTLLLPLSINVYVCSFTSSWPLFAS